MDFHMGFLPLLDIVAERERGRERKECWEKIVRAAQLSQHPAHTSTPSSGHRRLVRRIYTSLMYFNNAW